MIKGILAGSLTLIAFYVFVQTGTADKVSGAGGLVTKGLKRLMSGDVAGVPQRKSTTAAGTSATAPGSINLNLKPGMA
jgi:hypothetical protein